jgi:nucleoside-diphosphate-sugar epimerase
MNNNYTSIFSGKRLVIFGCGYIGMHLARLAYKAGAEVTALTRNVSKAELLKAEGIQVVNADLSQTKWHNAIKGYYDYAVNCVGSSSNDLNGYEESYVLGMQSICSWNKHNPVGTFVYTSSTSVYPQTGGVLVDEFSSTKGVSERGQILIRAENIIHNASGICQNSNRYFILRLAGIYGPSRHYLLDQIKNGMVNAPLDNFLNLIYRDDAVAAVAACLEVSDRVESSIFNCSDNNPASKHEVVSWICNQLGINFSQIVITNGSGRSREGLNRRIIARSIMDKLNWRPRFSNYKEGYLALLNDKSA